MLKRFFRNIKIKKICKFYRIKNYTINKDGSIDVNGYVILSSRGLSKLPLKFRNVSGNFCCWNNQLTSLEGCPESVGGYFDCGDNKLTSLEGCPKSIGGSGFGCRNNKLTSFEGGPELVGVHFDCQNNNITTFEHLPFSIGGGFYCLDNPIYQIWKLFRDYSKIELLDYYDVIREPNIIIKYRLNCF